MRLLLLPILTAVLLLGPVGCSTRTVETAVRWYPERDADVVIAAKVERSGEHFVAIQTAERGLRPWRGVTAMVDHGDNLGFELDSQGVLWAMSPDSAIDLGTVPPGVQFVAWATEVEQWSWVGSANHAAVARAVEDTIIIAATFTLVAAIVVAAAVTGSELPKGTIYAEDLFNFDRHHLTPYGDARCRDRLCRCNRCW
ncbi:MAG: hypothetical protein AAGI46_06945 [Planctomycetota bacterium]